MEHEEPVDNIQERTIRIVHTGVSSSFTQTMMRLAGQLRIGLLIEQMSSEAIEKLRAQEAAMNVLIVADDYRGRALAQPSWTDVEALSPWINSKPINPGLIQARLDCAHGTQATERSKRIHQCNVGWKRFSARSVVLHERIRM